MFQINYENVKHILQDLKQTIVFDDDDLDYLIRYLNDASIKVNISLVDLGRLYNKFSEEKWCASWEDDAEGQFVTWLKDKINNR